MAERLQTRSQWWIYQFWCCPAPADYVFWNRGASFWRLSSAFSLRQPQVRLLERLLLYACRSEMVHSNAERLNIVSIDWTWNPLEDRLYFSVHSQKRTTAHTCDALLELFTTSFWRTHPWNGCSSLWNDESKVGYFKISLWVSAHQFAALKLSRRAKKHGNGKRGEESGGQSNFLIRVKAYFPVRLLSADL